MTCPYCTGSHFLNDTPGLGPCVCCTPEALEAAEVEAAGLQEQLDHANLRLTEAWEAIGGQREGMSLADAIVEGVKAIVAAANEYDPHWDSLGDVAEIVAEAVEAIPDAADAFRSYLVSIGQPANPVTLADPHLQAMADALF